MPHRRRIDPDSHTPRYHQLADILRERIQRGTYKPGEMLPPEQRLAQEYELGVDTVRDALSVLRREGRIITRRGQGSQVRPATEPTVIPVGPGARISDRMPTEEERRRMNLPEGTPVIVISRPGQPDQVVRGGGETIIETTSDNTPDE